MTARATRPPTSPSRRGRRCFACRASGTVRRSGLRVRGVTRPRRHRATGRDLGGFVHRGRQLVDTLMAAGPLAVNYRGRRLPLVGWVAAFHGPAVAAVAAIGLADDLWSGA